MQIDKFELKPKQRPKLVENKGGLMARAFQTEDISLTVTEDTMTLNLGPAVH